MVVATSVGRSLHTASLVPAHTLRRNSSKVQVRHGRHSPLQKESTSWYRPS